MSEPEIPIIAPLSEHGIKEDAHEIIKFCCCCGIEFAEHGLTGQYFGCSQCKTIVKISVLDAEKL